VDRSSGKIPKSVFFGTTDRFSNESVSKKPALWIALLAKSPRAYFLAQQITISNKKGMLSVSLP